MLPLSMLAKVVHQIKVVFFQASVGHICCFCSFFGSCAMFKCPMALLSTLNVARVSTKFSEKNCLVQIRFDHELYLPLLKGRLN